MPVVGHAIAGLALATLAHANARKIEPVAFGRWASILVVLAYVPDAVSQLGITAGWRAAPVISHSLVFAVATAVVLAPLLARACAIKKLHGFALALMSLLLHDSLDILQSSGRTPLWPLPYRIDVGSWIPVTLHGELLTCSPFLIGAIAWRWRQRGLGLPTRSDWAGLLAVGIISCVAASASELRERREHDLNHARNLAESGNYQAALQACATADRWPWPAAPGRVDYVRGMSWWGLGRPDRAEVFYSRSYEADPGYIWTVGDLAVLYASSNVLQTDRRQKAELLLIVLQDRFSADPALPGLVARVRRRLDTPR